MQPDADSTAVAELSDVQLRVVESLRGDGIAVVPFRELLGEALWDEAVADIAPFVREGEQARESAGDAPASKDEIILRRFHRRAEGGRQAFSFASPWLRLGASERMLGIVNAYRGRPLKLFYVDNWFTLPYPAAEKRVASQRWHRDPEEEHVVKVFSYFSDVDEEAGPFEYVPGSSTGGRYGDLWPWGGDVRIPKPREFDEAIPPADRLTLTGPAGTMIFCDTGGFHRGGFARSKPRVLSICTYLSAESDEFRAGRRFDVEPEALAAELPADVRFALE